MIEYLQQADRNIFIFLNNLGVEKYDAFWLQVTQQNTWIPLYITFILLIVWRFRKNRKNIAISLIGLGLSLSFTVLFTNFVKHKIARARPNNAEVLHDLIRILKKPETYSFFSAHASTSMVVTTFVVLVLRKKMNWVYVFYLWPLLFSWSRIYVGVHYPSDIFVGLLVGFLIALLGYYVTCQMNNRLARVRN